VLSDLESLIANARLTGSHGQIISAARRALEILGIAPLDFGEDRGELPNLKLALRIAFMPPLVVRFGVNDESRMVWIQSIRMLPRRNT
jgi:hypothetical protein